MRSDERIYRVTLYLSIDVNIHVIKHYMLLVGSKVNGIRI